MRTALLVAGLLLTTAVLAEAMTGRACERLFVSWRAVKVTEFERRQLAAKRR